MTMKDYADLSDEDQVALILGSPDDGNTNNAPGFPDTIHIQMRLGHTASRVADIEQPPQDPDWIPKTAEIEEWI